MIKKYFALSLIAASVAIAGCSDDDDDDDNGTGTPGVESPVATPGVGGSVYDTIVLSTEHTMLRDAIDAAGLADTLDDETMEFTVFAPNNAAFEALAEALVGDALVQTLAFHVVEGTFDSVALADLISVTEGDATLPTLLEDASLTFTLVGEGQGLAVNGTAILAADLYPAAPEVETPVEGETETPAEGETETPAEGETETPADFVTTGVVHSIGAVLIPSEATDPGVVDPPATTGAVDEVLADAGIYEIFRTSVSQFFGTNLDDSAWTVFVPNDTVLGDAGLTDLTAPQLQAHIISSGALNPDALAAVTTVMVSDNTEYVVANDGTTTTVDGKAVALIATGAGGAQIYSIDGVLAGAGAAE